jgi:hypothetical protein
MANQLELVPISSDMHHFDIDVPAVKRYFHQEYTAQ